MRVFQPASVLFGALSFLLLFAPAMVLAKAETAKTQQGVEVKIEELADGLDHPWGMEFLPDGRLLVTERNSGKLYILNADRTKSKPLEGVPEVLADGQGGLMDVALDPGFKKNGYVYLSYAKPGQDGKSTTALGRGKLSGSRIEGFQDIFVQEPYIDDSKHFGNRIAFSPDGRYLFFALGERFQFDPAQDLSNHLGTVIRIHPDGSVPKDNPFTGRKGVRAEIWSYGHRNIEAMAFQPGTGALWIGEMGPLGGDELNQIEKGANYGWPVVSAGKHYDGRTIPDPSTHPEFKAAALTWTPVISPSGMAFYQGGMFPAWKGSAIIGGLTHEELVRVTFDGTRPREEDRLSMPGRIRDVAIASDGSIYALMDEGDGKVLRISSMGKASK
ncbi:PQQ-dependent sugar dehydrogenase [Desulfocurvibacter africanus]|uniref:PQQ-dependent sugar dehydrogenase n=1 Tax=Desulfocurvibacter africanus TaxID=873 RepID=UPI002FDA57D5